MKYNSDITALIYAMNENQRIEFLSFINNIRDELNSNLSNQGSNFSCDNIIESIDSINSFEKIQKLKELAANKGETTIQKEDWDVHIYHCCSTHGCKYGDIDCPVKLELVEQKYPCEFCMDNDELCLD